MTPLLQSLNASFLCYGFRSTVAEEADGFIVLQMHLMIMNKYENLSCVFGGKSVVRQTTVEFVSEQRVSSQLVSSLVTRHIQQPVVITVLVSNTVILS